jgi:hypothetical protein
MKRAFKFGVAATLAIALTGPAFADRLDRRHVTDKIPEEIYNEAYTDTRDDSVRDDRDMRRDLRVEEHHHHDSDLNDRTAYNNRTSERSVEISRDERSNSDLGRRVEAAIRRDDLSPSTPDVRVSTDSKGIVTLRGTVKSERERDRVCEIARDIAGSKNVRDELRVSARKVS